MSDYIGDACLKVSAGKSTNVNILNDPVEHEGLGIVANLTPL